MTDTHPLFADRPELDDLAFAMVHRLHSQIPSDKRPTSWSDFSEAQVLRAKEAAALAYDAGRKAVNPLDLTLIPHYVAAKQFVEETFEPSFVIFVRHPVLSVNVFAENREKALLAFGNIFSVDANPPPEVWVGTCAKTNAIGDPEWHKVGEP